MWNRTLSQNSSCPLPSALLLASAKGNLEPSSSFGLDARGFREMVRLSQSLQWVCSEISFIFREKQCHLVELFFFKYCKVLCNNKKGESNDKYLSFLFCLYKTKALFRDESYLITPGISPTVFTPIFRSSVQTFLLQC